MKSKTDKKTQQTLAAQSAANEKLFLDAYTKANAPDPLEVKQRTDALAFLDAVDGTNGPFDVTKTPGMAPYLDLYNREKQGQSADANTDTGMFQLGATGGSPGMVARMREQNAMRRDERAAGDLSSSFAAKYADVTGNQIPFLLKYKQARDLGLTGMMANKSTASTGIWAGFKPEDSIWSKMWQQAARGAGTAAMAAGG